MSVFTFGTSSPLSSSDAARVTRMPVAGFTRTSCSSTAVAKSTRSGASIFRTVDGSSPRASSVAT